MTNKTSFPRCMLGMYVHTHWAYSHPYAARTWTLADWTGYLGGLCELGYNTCMVWPLLDSMPAEPTAGDRNFLTKLAAVIDVAHERYDMQVLITAAPNTIGNERAAAYAFEERPYFTCEQKINPRDPHQVEAFLRGRRRQFELIGRADALVVIDSDPGGYIGSTNAEFVDLLQGQVGAFRVQNPEAGLIYWMLAGWESYNRFWAAQLAVDGERPQMWDDWQGEDFVETLSLVRERIAEPWCVYAWLPQHMAAVEALGLGAKVVSFPYGVIEGEPSFPLTNCNAAAIAGELTGDRLRSAPLGVMANAQTHCLQLPQTYLFAHYAQGGTPATADLDGFAGELLPGAGRVLAAAWRAIESADAARLRDAAGVLENARATPDTDGRLGGLLFGDGQRFLVDLVMNLELRAAFCDLQAALDGGGDAPRAVRGVLSVLRPYRERVGFADAYHGPLYSGFNEQLSRLGNADLDAVLGLFTDWRDPTVRHGLADRLLAAAEAYCRAEGV